MNELVRKIQAHDKEGFITFFRKLSLTERLDVLSQQTSEGKTFLHYAAESGDIELVRHLLGLEISLDVKDLALKTAADLAQEAGYTEIAELLNTRMEWKQKNPSRLPLNKALNLIEGSYHAIEGGKNKPLVLVLGETGVGKSTLINYLNGAKYAVTGPKSRPRTELKSGVDVARIGHNPMDSETLYPQVLSIDCGNDSLDIVDLAGINGTREPVVELAGTVSTHLLSKIARSIKAILFVVDIPSLNSARGGPFRQTIKTLNKIMREDPKGDVRRTVFFAITKSHPGETKREVVDGYLRPLLRQLEEQMLQGNLSRDDTELYLTVKLMVENAEEKIFVPNVCDEGDARKELFNALLHSSQLSPQNLDLLHMDKHQESFIEMATFLSGEYLRLSDDILKNIPSKISFCESAVSENATNINKWESEIAEAKKVQEEGMTPEKAMKMMAERQAQLKDLETKYSELRGEKIRLQMSIERAQDTIKELDTDTPVEYGVPYRFNHIGELQIIPSTQSNPAPSTIGKDIGSKVGTFLAASHPTLAVASEVAGMVFDLFKTRDIPAPTIEKMRGTGTYIFENSASPAPGSILSVKPILNCGGWGHEKVEGNTFTLPYYYPLGESATAEVAIKIATRDVPDNKSRIERSKNEAKANAEKLSQTESTLAELSAQIDVLSGEINALQMNGISAAAQQEALKTQIQQREDWIKIAQQAVTDLQERRGSLEKQRDKNLLQISVNKEVFETLCKIIQLLQLNYDPQYKVLNEFVKSFSAKPMAEAKRASHSPSFFAKHSNELLRMTHSAPLAAVTKGGDSCISQMK